MKIIALHSKKQCAEFEAYLNTQEMEYEKVNGLSCIYFVKGEPEHNSIRISEDDRIIYGAEAIVANPDFTGGAWHLGRMIRRRPSWPTDRLRGPINTTFESLRDGTGVDAYIIDSGIDLANTQLTGRAVNVWEGITSNGLGDDEGHGTSVTSLIGGSVSGTARAANLRSFRVFDSNRSSPTTRILTAMGEVLSDYNSRTAPAVVNMSIGGTNNSATVSTAMGDLINAGIVVCVSAGNDIEDIGTIDSTYAEADADVIVVGGIMPDDGVYFQGGIFGTNWGSRIDVLAPSFLTWAAHATNAQQAGGGPNEFRTFGGTSASSPIVAGIVACLLQGQPRLTTRAQVQAVRQFVMDTATTGRRKTIPLIPNIADRIAYLDPRVASENIPGL